ncbi:MAG: M1 family metallopeptidase [Saprospiraceae bacterium]|nr:M1 family metallopeptidase [Saprospiraceae bacterium]
MKKLVLFVLITLAAAGSQAQSYFQQQVNYRINVTLDDVKHTVSGDIIIEYQNNSPVALDSIWMHLWGNAFKNTETEYAKQELRNGDAKFYFSSEDEKGYYTGLDFSVYGQKVTWAFDKKNPDIAVLVLPQPLPSGSKALIKTPFTLKIPASWSRLGHVGTSYQMTQWYPKPAVFDKNGWHPMPYLDMGEFYSEFGNFDVTITLPENYVVGASGVLQTESEQKFLEQKVAETQGFIKNGFPKGEEFPPSATTMKTIHYIAERVHDFAWFADKRFHVVKDEAVLPSGKKIPTWGMFTNAESDIWTKGAEYVRRAVEFYSQHVGEYPWPQATAVHSALSAGGGMEYPMITVIGNSGSARSLDDVITHEVGHNWFYGIFATNERDHAWMDEGINSYYEHRYMKQYYGSRVNFGLPKFMTKHIDGDVYETGIQLQCRRRMDQAPAAHSNDFSQTNYGLMVYMKTASAMHHLEEYLGTERFDKVMKSYFNKWGFKHPQPEDLKAHFEQETGKNLDWFFKGYIGSIDQMDYCVAKISGDATNGYKLVVKNKGELAAPFPIVAYQDSVAVQTKWYEGFSGEQELDFPATDCDRLVLDGEHVTLEVYRKNNTVKTSGVLKRMEPLQARFLAGAVPENSRRTTLNLMPVIASNKYDGTMLGLAIHNGILPARRFQFQWTPLYGFESKDLVGTANMQYNIFPKSEKIKQLSIGLRSKAFNYTYGEYGFEGGAYEEFQYRTIVPFVRVELMRSPNSKFYQVLQFRSILAQEQEFDYSKPQGSPFEPPAKKWADRTMQEISWELGDRRVLNPYSLKVALEQGNFDDLTREGEIAYYLKSSVEANFAITYEHKRNIYIRLFAGGFLQNDYRKRGNFAPSAFNLTGEGYNDYRYDEYYFGRTEYDNIWAQQISIRDGGMKVPVGGPYNEGRSNNFLLAANFKADLPKDLPLKLPLKPYFDIGYFDDSRPFQRDLSLSDQIWWQGGFALEFGKGVFGIYIPLVNSTTLRGTDDLPGLYDQSGRDKWYERIAFTFDLNRLNPWNLMDKIQF